MLNDKEPGFVEFRNLVDSKMKLAVENLYGKFSEFTAPIISQATLAEFSECFKLKLPRQYFAIMVLLNKQVSKVMNYKIKCLL